MAASLMLLDFSRPLRPSERKAFGARKSRLSGQFGESATQATAALLGEPLGGPGLLSTEGLRIRDDFSFLRVPVLAGTASDRRAPTRSLRPSATRLVSSQGIALRLYLTMLAVTQVRLRPGQTNTVDLPVVGSRREFSWSDLVATGAIDSGRGGTKSIVRDKKARSLRTALNALDEAQLVALTGDIGKRGRHEGFVLLDEAGRQLPGDPDKYRVPASSDDYYVLPVGFVTNGWLHVLEDTEIAVLLMIACGKGSLTQREAPDLVVGERAIPANVRLDHYGLHRDPFSRALKTLAWFGLINVREIGRHDDGRAEDGDLFLHRLSLRLEGFDGNGLDVVLKVIERQLERQ